MVGEKRIAVHIPDFSGGGAERMMIHLSEEFAARGAAVDMVVSRTEGPRASEVGDDVNVVDLEAEPFPGYSALGALQPLRSYLRRADPDALLSALTRANVVALLACKTTATGTRVVVSERNHLSSTVANAGLRMKSLPWLVRRTYPWADCVVPISQGVADDLASVSGLPRAEMRTIYNPVVNDTLRRQAEEPCPHAWFDEDAAPVVLGVGSLTPQKDFPTLVRAFERVRRRREQPIRLMILGEGPERERLESLLNELDLADVAALPGFVDNPLPFMREAAVFVLSSAWEGFGNVVVESLLCGTPVVATDCPSGPAEILAGGKYGRLVPVGDEEALAQATAATLDASVDEESLRARAERFSADEIAVEYLEVLLSDEFPAPGERSPGAK